LTKTRERLFGGINSAFTEENSNREKMFQTLEDTLLQADIGILIFKVSIILFVV
jgi:signal recognition particle GTPase